MQALLANWQLQLQALATTEYPMLHGSAIGFERELKNRPAGDRTHVLVAGAAAPTPAVLMLLGWIERRRGIFPAD